MASGRRVCSTLVTAGEYGVILFWIGSRGQGHFSLWGCSYCSVSMFYRVFLLGHGVVF